MASVCFWTTAWLVVLRWAVGKVSAWKWLWKILTGDLVKMLGAFSSEAVSGFTGFSNLSGLGVGNGLLSVVASVDGYKFGRDFVSGTCSFTVPGIRVVTIPVESIIFLLELVIGSSGRLGLTLRSGADWTVSSTTGSVSDSWASQLRCLWNAGTSWGSTARIACYLNTSGNSQENS